MLTAQDKQLLEQIGHSKQDIAFIIQAEKKTTYALIQPNGNQLTIGKEEAIERLGREEWLRGLARSAFYIETKRFGLNGERIALHSRVYQ